MVDSTKCPVCGRKDIPDYQKSDVRCPECGSDLKIFRILDSLERDNKSKSTVWKPVGIFAMIAALLFALLYFTKGTSPTAEKEKMALLQDSVAALNERIKDLQAGGHAAAPVVAASQQKVSASDSEKADEPAEKTEPAADEVTAPSNLVTVRDGKKYYTVRKGDTWWGIANRLYKGKVKDEELAKMNGKSKNTTLEIGQELLVK